MPLAFERHLSLYPLCICFHYTDIHGLDFWLTVLYFELLRFPLFLALGMYDFLDVDLIVKKIKDLVLLNQTCVYCCSRVQNRFRSSGIPTLFLLPIKRAISIFGAYICLPLNFFLLTETA